MLASRSPSFAAWATEERLWRWGQALLLAALALGVVLLVLLAWKWNEALPLVPLVLAGGVVIAYLIHHPFLHLCVVLLGFSTLLLPQEGFQFYEVLYGTYYLSYITSWFIYQTFFRQERIIRSSADWLLIFFLIYGTASFGLTAVYGGNAVKAFSEWIALTLFLFYFPIKEACRNNPKALRHLLIVFVLLALFVLGKNLYEYYQSLSSAEALWQVTENRERQGERLLILGLLGSITFIIHAPRPSKALFLQISFAIPCLAGVAIGQSRGAWVASLFGTILLFIIVNYRLKVRLIIISLFSILSFYLLSLFIGDYLSIIIFGLSDRLASIGTATTDDLSLINRFYEWNVVFSEIIKSPIVGHGWAVPYDFFDITILRTVPKHFVHNTYLALLYRHGVIGFAIIFTFFVFMVRQGLSMLRKGEALSYLERPVILASIAALAALSVAATMEGMMINHDGVFTLIFPSALLSGIWQVSTSKTSPTVS